jgi:hypothetical protein
MSPNGLGRGQSAQQLPEKLHVGVVQRAPHGEVMQLARGERVQFIAGGHASDSTAWAAGPGA